MQKLIFLTILLLLFSHCSGGTQNTQDLNAHIKNQIIELHNSSHLEPLITQASDKKLVLLGEASHGTHEYYAWRDSISRRLIAEHGFNFILVEGDFASLYELNRYVKDMPDAAASAKDVLMNLERWPQWMWVNEEVVALAEWLREHNDALPKEKKVGFYGMDVYDEWRSKEVLMQFLFNKNPNLYEEARKSYACFSPYNSDSRLYAQFAQTGQANCSQYTKEVVNMLLNNKDKLHNTDAYEFFYALQNAYVFKNAEKFYRKSALGLNSASWNARAIHMHETSKRLLDLYGNDSKGIVWAHNTHIGDAGHTEMRRVNQVNIGQLSRDTHGEDNVMLIGFTTYEGYVKAGAQWGGPMQKMKIPPAVQNSLEERLKRVGTTSFFLMFDEKDRTHPEFIRSIGNRAVGVVYNPQFDARQFVPTVVPKRYDAIIFFKETKALNPLHR